MRPRPTSARPEGRLLSRQVFEVSPERLTFLKCEHIGKKYEAPSRTRPRESPFIRNFFFNSWSTVAPTPDGLQTHCSTWFSSRSVYSDPKKEPLPPVKRVSAALWMNSYATLSLPSNMMFSLLHFPAFPWWSLTTYARSSILFPYF